MSPDTLSRVFEPFSATKGDGQGTGLGMATVNNIVEQFGGHVRITSAPEEGTTIRVVLPAVHEPAEVDQAPDDAEESYVGHETVLVCEDEAPVRELISTILRSHEYTVVPAESAHHALELANTYSGPIHLLLSDVIMPGMNGRQLADAFNSRRPQTPVLYVSGYASDIIARHGVLEPGTSFLAKPFTSLGRCRSVYETLHRHLTSVRPS